MEVIKQIVTVPASRRLQIQLPEDAAAHEEAEVIVLFKSSTQSHEAKLALMREAATDELFMADLVGVSEDFAYADAEDNEA
jgi:hypothetical protein